MKNSKIFTAVLIIAALLVGGCVATGNYGYLRRSISLTEMVERGEVSPEYNYYYSGPAGLPDALIGLNKHYTLEEGFWKPVALDSAILKNWVNAAGTYRTSMGPNAYYAYNMYGPDGKKIGMWYGYQDDANIMQEGENTFSIYTPKARNLIRGRGFLRDFPVD
jgi:hypothetical protein